jgi:hypothetical protein
MIVLAGFALGAVWGVSLAGKRGGNRLDKAQYGAGFGIAFALLGLFLTIFVEHML